jgi:predicted acylesterase/phospholipase RssA
MTKRALVLGGGGPALGTIIGAQEAFAEADISFDVVSAACIGAWVAVIHYSLEGTPQERVLRTYEWFKPVFQPKDVHDSFPINRVFAPDLRGNAKAHWNYLTDPRTFRSAFVPAEMFRVGVNTLKFFGTPSRWFDESSVNLLALEWMGAHPLSRLAVGLQYRTAQTGGARIFYEDAPLLREVNIPNLYKPDRPEIRYNAINLQAPSGPQPVLFTNRIDQYGMVDMRTLCACSALPSIFAPVEVQGQLHCEGATVDAVQFINLLEDHPDLDEIWILRIVALDQAAAPKDQTEALSNSFMIFASALGDANIKAFRTHAAALGFKGRIVEIPVPRVKWEWSYPNLTLGRRLGASAAKAAILESQSW